MKKLAQNSKYKPRTNNSRKNYDNSRNHRRLLHSIIVLSRRKPSDSCAVMQLVYQQLTYSGYVSFGAQAQILSLISGSYKNGKKTDAMKNLTEEYTSGKVELCLVRIVKQNIVQPGKHSLILVHSKRSELKTVEPILLQASSAQLKTMQRVADFTTGRTFS